MYVTNVLSTLYPARYTNGDDTRREDTKRKDAADKDMTLAYNSN